MQRINSHLYSKRKPPYVLNLDPAVRTVPFDCNIDIRDSINYKEVMKQYNLGPNGGILTSLNLFATKVDQVLELLEKRCRAAASSPSATQDPSTSITASSSNSIEHILVDTPGQIEVFVWSASGQILLSSIASSFPTVIAYIIDTPRTASTSTFMSNMLYACSILYKTKLPMILVFNKTDVQSADFAKDWMTDFETFQAALQKEEETGTYGGTEGTQGGPAVGGSGYMSSLLNSMSMVLEEFYKHLNVVAVSSLTGGGIDEFFVAVQGKAEEFEREYRPELERRQKQRQKERDGRKEQELGRLLKDLNVDEKRAGKTAASERRAKAEPETISDLESEGEDDEPDVEHEDPDEGGSDDDLANGLSRRYKNALDDGEYNGRTPSGDDLSFARYIQGNAGK